MDGFALGKEEGPQINFHGTKMVVRSRISDGTYSLIEMINPPNIGRSLHIRPNSTEAYYVLERKYSIQCGKKS